MPRCEVVQLIMLTVLAGCGAESPESAAAETSGTQADSTTAVDASTFGSSSVGMSVGSDDSTTSAADDTGSTGIVASSSGVESTGDTGDCSEECCLSLDCDVGEECIEGVCVAVVCGDGVVTGSEQCEDGNAVDGDGCDTDCTYTELEVHIGWNTACALIEGGRVRCWGNGLFLGYGDGEDIGDNELPYVAGDLPLPGPATQLDVGIVHTCAVLAPDNDVVCWGSASEGETGYGNEIPLGDDEDVSVLQPVDVGGDVESLVTTTMSTCVVLTGGQVKCWGRGAYGTLGYGNAENIGDDELPSSVGVVSVGAAVQRLYGGLSHGVCAVDVADSVRCWGHNTYGQLGFVHTYNVGDTELPSSQLAHVFEPPIAEITIAQWSHACFLQTDGALRCVGDNNHGQLGRGHANPVGLTPAAEAPAVGLGDFGPPVSVATGRGFTCVLSEEGAVRCWGQNYVGQLGLGHELTIGDDESISDAEDVVFERPVIQIDAGHYAVCAVLDDYTVHCWGGNDSGQLGLGHVAPIGDDEPASEAPATQILDPAG